MKASPVSHVVVLMSLIGLTHIHSHAAISDAFNDNDDVGWDRYEPLAEFGAPLTFSFPDFNYRIQSPPSPDPLTLGVARGGSFRHDAIHLTKVVGFVTDWDDLLDQSFGIVFKASSIGRSTLDGYAIMYSTAGLLSAFRIDDDELVSLASVPVVLDPTHDYGFVIQFSGGGFGAALGDQTDDLFVTSVGARDGTYVVGSSGFYAYSNTPDGGFDVTFDFFQAGNVPEPRTIVLLVFGIAVCFVCAKMRGVSRPWSVSKE